MLLQKFLIEIRDRKRSNNVFANHLSRILSDALKTTDTEHIKESFPATTFYVSSIYSLVCQYCQLPSNWTVSHRMVQTRERLFAQLKYYFWEDPKLFKLCPDQVIRRCVPESEFHNILITCHTLVANIFSERKLQ